MKQPPDIRSEWDRPTKYERWYVSSLGRAYGASLEAVLRLWLSEAVGTRALDVGCGPGLAVERLFTPGVEVWAIDCSLQMARKALSRSEEVGGPCFVVAGSVERLPFHKESFDLVLCVNCLEFVGYRQKAFNEIARVLAPGGAAVIGVLNRRSVWELTRRLWRPLSRGAYYRGRFFREKDVRAHCTVAGLRVEEVRTVVHFPPIPPGPFREIYHRLDLTAQRRGMRCGGVILVRASKPK